MNLYKNAGEVSNSLALFDALHLCEVKNPSWERADSVDVNALGRVSKRYDNNNASLYQTHRYDAAGRLTSTTNRGS